MDDPIYRRELGLTYDEDALRRAVDSGLGGRTNLEQIDQYANDGADLYIEQSNGSLNDYRLQDIEYDLAFETDPEQIVLLEAEKIVRTEVRLAEESRLNPKYSRALRDWLMSELDRRLSQGEPVDAEMYVEAEILADFIAEAQADDEDADLIEIAENMKAVIESQRALTDFALQANLSAEEVSSLIEALRRDLATESAA